MLPANSVLTLVSVPRMLPAKSPHCLQVTPGPPQVGHTERRTRRTHLMLSTDIAVREAPDTAVNEEATTLLLYLLGGTWAPLGWGPCSLNAKFWCKDVPADGRALRWPEAQHETWRETQTFQPLLPRKQLYVGLPIHSEITKGHGELIAFQLHFLQYRD